MHEQDGPVALLLGQAFTFAQKRPRAMAVLSLHICPLFLEAPALMTQHLALIRQLLLYAADDVSQPSHLQHMHASPASYITYGYTCVALWM